MLPPGGLEEWPNAARDWEDEVAATVERVLSEAEETLPPNMAGATAADASELRTIDWPAAPARVRACLGTEEADSACDAKDPATGDVGRRAFHEEYAEWRVVRNGDGTVSRFELTTEFAAFWLLLAEHAPQRAIEQIAEFARTDTTAAGAIFGTAGIPGDPKERRAAFAAAMLGPRPGPFNNGLAAITCLTRSDNTLGALVNLVTAAAAAPQRVVDPASGETRFPSGSEAIERLRDGSAIDCRNSDPVVVERVVRLATERRLIRFDDPIGVYVLEVQTDDLLTPDGSPLPAEWCMLGRGAATPDGGSLAQRVEIEVPPNAGFTLSDVRSRRTGARLVHGGQVAELVQLGVRVRCGPPNAIDVDVESRPPALPRPCGQHPGCADLQALAAGLAGAA